MTSIDQVRSHSVPRRVRPRVTMQEQDGLATTAHTNTETHLFRNVDVTQVEALEHADKPVRHARPVTALLRRHHTPLPFARHDRLCA